MDNLNIPDSAPDASVITAQEKKPAAKKKSGSGKPRAATGNGAAGSAAAKAPCAAAAADTTEEAAGAGAGAPAAMAAGGRCGGTAGEALYMTGVVDANGPLRVIHALEPMVRLIYIDSVMPDNSIPIGKGRVITGSGRRFSVPLAEFESDFMTPLTINLLHCRRFIVLEGLSDEQRRQYDCLYAEGEVIRDESVFDSFLDMGIGEAAETFRQLCPQHRELVGRRFTEAYLKGDSRITRDRVETLEQISAHDYPDGHGVFRSIIRGMNGSDE